MDFSRFLVECDEAPWMISAPRYGDMLQYWTDPHIIRENPDFDPGRGHRIVEIDVQQLVDVLNMCKEEGYNYIAVDIGAKGSGRMLRVEDALIIESKFLAFDHILGPSLEDEFVKLLDSKRELGIPVTEKDLQMPVDCPNCGQLVIVQEDLYRSWRNNPLKSIVCPHCSESFSQSSFSCTECASCGEKSGTMPLSLCKHMAGKWKCPNCTKASIKPISVSPKRTAETGCMITVLGLSSIGAWGLGCLLIF